jgi:hypothetical protein
MKSHGQRREGLGPTNLSRRFDTLTWWLSIGAVLLALSILTRSAYLVTRGIARLDDPINLAMYFGLPMCLAAAMMLSLWLPPSDRARLLLLCASAGLGAYALELVLEMTAPISTPRPPMSTVLAASDTAAAAARLRGRFGVEVDSRPAGEVLRALRTTDAGAIPIVTPANHLFQRTADGVVTSPTRINGIEVMPLAGPSNRTTLLCNENGPWVQYRADRHGFNNPDAVWRSNNLEIAVVGDSFAHGYCVPPSHSFAGLIHRHQPNTLNLGIAGDGPLLMLATLTEYLPALRPRIVLWCYFEGNDLEDLQVERRSAVLSNYLRDRFRQAGLRDQDALDRAIMAHIPEPRPSAMDTPRRHFWSGAIDSALSFAKLTDVRHRLGLIRPISPSDLDAVADYETSNLAAFRVVLEAAQRRTASWGGRLYFVYLPNWERYTARYRARGNDKRETVLRLVSQLGIPVIDIDPAFRSSGDPPALFPFRLPGHYTEAGHALVSEMIMRALSLPNRTHNLTATTGP